MVPYSLYDHRIGPSNEPQNDIGNYLGPYIFGWLVTGPLAHTRYILRYIGCVTEGGFRDIPKDFCPAEDMKAARQGVCNRLAFQGVCNRGLVARNATTPLFGTPPHDVVFETTLLFLGMVVRLHILPHAPNMKPTTLDPTRLDLKPKPKFQVEQ